MLEKKLIEKIFDNIDVNGFKWHSPFLIFNGTACLNIDDLQKDWVDNPNPWAYPLFLQRVIEGINEDIRFRIKQEGNILDVYVCGEFRGVKSIKQIGGYSDDEAKEQTIKYILENI